MVAFSSLGSGSVYVAEFRTGKWGIHPSIDDIDKPGGWLFRVRTPPDLARTFYVYELDQSVAIVLLKKKLRLSPNETIEAVAQANIHSLTRHEAGRRPATWISTPSREPRGRLERVISSPSWLGQQSHLRLPRLLPCAF